MIEYDVNALHPDLQMVEISLRVLYKPDSNNLPFIYRRLGQDFDERVLPSIVNEVTKAVVARFNASELLTKREAVSRMIHEMLVKRAADFHILLDDVSITHLAFSPDYTAAVERKQVAQQDAERSKYIVEQAIQEKRSIIIRAEGEARAAELVGKVRVTRSLPPLSQLLTCLMVMYVTVYSVQPCILAAAKNPGGQRSRQGHSQLPEHCVLER
jgi:regulator of protease activity HflC (stomatin/prohibitin superfamily)